MKKSIFAAIGLISLGIIFGIFLVSSFSSGTINDLWAEEKVGADRAPVALSPDAMALNNSFVAASQAVTNTVVSIGVETESTADGGEMNEQFREFFRFFGEPQEKSPRRGQASGSGVIISSNGYIVTNNHVVENAVSDGITVTLHDQRVFKKAKLIGRDPLTDLAVIKIDAEGLKPVHFANIESVKIGEWVIAVGNPLGLNSTVTSGIVSAIGRGQLNLMNRDRYAVENFIQTDAAINPGNSGGGLYNLEGSLVGINTAIATRTGTYIGYGFAIPVDLVKAVIDDLIEDGEIDRGYIGVEIKTVDATEAKALGLDNVSGVLVSGVLKGKSADKAGVEISDVILEVDSKPVRSSQELQSEIVLRKAGDKVKLTLWRDGKKIYKTVTLEARESDKNVADAVKGGESEKDETEDVEPLKFEKLGFSVEPLTNEIKKSYDIDSGVLITRVERYSTAADRGLFPQGVIVKADKEKVKTPKQLEKIIESKKSGEALLLQVKYKDDTRLVALEIPGA